MARLADFHRDYWNAFLDASQSEKRAVPRSHPSNCYMIFPLGVGGAHLAASVLVSKNLVTFYLLVQGKYRDEMYHHLYAHKVEIDAKLRETPVWAVSKTSKRARVTQTLDVSDISDRQDWPRQHRWIIEKSILFDETFRPRLRELKGTS